MAKPFHFLKGKVVQQVKTVTVTEGVQQTRALIVVENYVLEHHDSIYEKMKAEFLSN